MEPKPEPAALGVGQGEGAEGAPAPCTAGARLTAADFPASWGDTIPRGAFTRRSDIVGSVDIPARFVKIEGGGYGTGAFDGCDRITEV